MTDFTDNELFAINIAARGDTSIGRLRLMDKLTTLASTYKSLFASSQERDSAMFLDLAERVGQLSSRDRAV